MSPPFKESANKVRTKTAKEMLGFLMSRIVVRSVIDKVATWKTNFFFKFNFIQITRTSEPDMLSTVPSCSSLAMHFFLTLGRL